MEFGEETTSYSWPPKIPTKLRKKLHCKTPCTTADQIQAKLRLADLRRQEHYEKLSNKARPKPRSPSRSEDEDLAQRLEAKLEAAAQKRSSILEKAQARLARLDELRQAARTGVEKRYERERERLGSRVRTRIEQAEANRTLMLKAHRQRRASLRERSSQSLLRKATRESKYKERVRAAILQKRTVAEKNRIGLLEAERKRVCARILQVRRVAKTVTTEREIERRRLKDQLEDRLQRARSQRAEYLRQRGRLHDSVKMKMDKHGDLLSRRLARCWRQFLKQRTTLDLAKTYDSLKINKKSVESMPFEQLAVLIESTNTLRAVKAVLDRFESRLRVLKSVASGSVENIDQLLKRVATPKKRVTPRKPLRAKSVSTPSPSVVVKNPAPPLPRYSVRVSLCAYMILSHPEAVFSGRGDREAALAKSAERFVREFELLLRIVLDGGPVSSSSDVDSDEVATTSKKRWTFRSQLETFDKAWCSYLSCFVVWKDKDAQSLEEDLVRAACQLELSMMQTCKISPDGESHDLTHDMKAVQRQVTEDQKLLREKVLHLSGDAGIKRMDSALSETRSKYFLAKENGSPTGSPIKPFISPSPPNSKAGPSVSSDKRTTKSVEKPSVVRSLFRDGDDSTPKGSQSSRSSPVLDGPLLSFVAENELIVNEYIHNRTESFTDIFTFSDEEDQSGVKEKIKETMKNAFWDSITESMKSENPDYDRVVRLVGEVRDEICQMAPRSWTQMIVEAIDLDILSQVLKSGNLDIHYLGKIMGFALDTLQKLSSPASDEEMKMTRQSLMKELADICVATDGSNYSSVIAMIKGLRFVLDQIQVLKQEISKARITLMAQLLKGPEGTEYLKNAFANRHGSPSDARSSLPLTVQWLSTVSGFGDREWEEHKSAILALGDRFPSHGSIPSTPLRSGGAFVAKPNVTKTEGDSLPECKGEKIDLMVRVGMLKLVSAVSGLTQENLPETFVLNFSRLRAVQAQIQKIIVIAVSVLICRQTLVTEKIVDNSKDIEAIISSCTERLVDLLNHIEDAGIEEIVESISQFSRNSEETNLASQKAVLTRMLMKSLQAGDPVFERVSRAVYTSIRGIVLGGSGPHGRKLADVALRQVGAARLTESVVEAARVLVVAATVSVSVHGQWYVQLIE